MEMENSTYQKQISTQQRQEIYNIGKEFAFEGLDESYFKANSEEELAIFRDGFQEGLKLQPAPIENTEYNGLKR